MSKNPTDSYPCAVRRTYDEGTKSALATLDSIEAMVGIMRRRLAEDHGKGVSLDVESFISLAMRFQRCDTKRQAAWFIAYQANGGK